MAIPIPFKPSAIAAIYQKFQRLQLALKKNRISRQAWNYCVLLSPLSEYAMKRHFMPTRRQWTDFSLSPKHNIRLPLLDATNVDQ